MIRRELDSSGNRRTPLTPIFNYKPRRGSVAVGNTPGGVPEPSILTFLDEINIGPSGFPHIIAGTTKVAVHDRTTSPTGVFGVYDYSGSSLTIVYQGVPTGGAGADYADNYAMVLDAAGETAYIANNEIDAIVPVDITNPAAPVAGTKVTSGSHLNSVRAIGLAGGRLVTGAFTSDDVVLWNISNRLAPTYISELVASSRGPLLGVSVGDYFYVIHSTTYVVRAYLCTGATPTIPGSTISLPTSPSWFNRTAVADKLMVTYNAGDAQIMDISDPANPVISTTLTGVNSRAATLVSTTRLLAQIGQELRLYDISNPASPIVLDSFNINTVTSGNSTSINQMVYDPLTKKVIFRANLNAADRLCMAQLA